MFLLIKPLCWRIRIGRVAKHEYSLAVGPLTLNVFWWPL